MRVILQRVKKSSVKVDEQLISEIGNGLMILVGITDEDTNEDLEWLCNKIASIRIFDDENHIMNKSIMEVDGEILAVSQFTLYASTKKGNRPSYIKASKGEIAEPMYNAFCNKLTALTGKETKKGKFGANMQVSLINDGPVTIFIDSKNRDL